MSLQYVRVSAVWRAGAAPADAVTAAAATTTAPMANHNLAGLCMCRLLPWLCGNRVEDRVEHACGPVADDVVGGKADRGLGFGRSLRGPVGEETGGQDAEPFAHAGLTKACSTITARSGRYLGRPARGAHPRRPAALPRDRSLTATRNLEGRGGVMMAPRRKDMPCAGSSLRPPHSRVRSRLRVPLPPRA